MDPLILKVPVLWEECTCTEYAACEILKAERVLNARLRMLIGVLYPKLERVWQENAAVQAATLLLLL